MTERPSRDDGDGSDEGDGGDDGSGLVELTRALVAIPSHEDPAPVAEHLAGWLGEHTPADVTVDGAENVVARVGSGEPSLALVGHHDVVPPADGQVDADGTPHVESRDDRLYGRGTADMKGPLAALCRAFRDVAVELESRGDGGEHRSDDGELVLASFAGEERGGVGARHAVERGFAPDYAVVGEGSTGYSAPGVTDVAVAHKGRRGSTLAAEGESAHAGEPGAGVNAVYRACDAVDVVRELSTPETEVFGRTLEGSLAVTEIDGGDAWNVVPDRCTVTVDERTVPGARADLERTETVPGVTWTVDQDLPPMRCSDRAFADLALAAARAVQGSETSGTETSGSGPPEHVVKPHATDAGHLSAAGVDCVVCGASEPGEAHTADESVSVAALERCERIYRRIASRVVVERALS